MALSTEQLRAYVRSALDTDEEELPNALVDVWRELADAYVGRFSPRWEFYFTEQELTTISGTWAYDLTTALGASFTEVVGVHSDSWALRPLPHGAALRSFDTSSDASTGTPRFWTRSGNSLYIWPRPDGTAVKVRGYRTPVLGQDPPDFPDEFHALVGEQMLVYAYEFQDDDIMSVQKQGRVDRNLTLLKPRFEAQPQGEGHILGGGEPTPWRPSDRLLFDFEV